MTTQIKRRRGTTTEHSTFTGAEGELTIDTTKDTVVVHDGSTAGGHPLAKESSITSKVDKAGDTMTGDLSFGDNDKAIFGAGSDLQIYHNEANSIVADVGQGTLSLQSNGAGITLWDSANSQELAQFYTGAVSKGVTLSRNGVEKLATTSTGVDITGTLTSDGLTVDGTSDLNGSITVGTTNTTELTGNDINLNRSTGGSYISQKGGGNLTFRTNDGSDRFRLNIDTNGDISFYEDTGTTPKFFWDASAESLGIGTSSPSVSLHVNSGNTNAVARFESTDASAEIDIVDSSGYSRISHVNGTLLFEADRGNTASSTIEFDVDGTERMRIDSNGRVGIGTTSPSRKLDVRTGAFNSAVAQFTGANDGRGLLISTFARASNDDSVDYDTPFGGNHTFSSSGSEKMRIDSSGMLNAYYGISVDGGTIKLDGNYPVGTANVALGDAALDSLTSGIRNTAVGDKAGTGITSGTGNVAIGDNTMTATVTGADNVAVGTYALNLNTSGTLNAALGGSALERNTTGSSNVAVGRQALTSNTTANNNTAVGYLSLYSNTTGGYNNAYGFRSLQYNTTASYNAAYGYASLYLNTTGQYNTAVGISALESNTTASANTAVGYQAGYSNTTGVGITAIGYQAVMNNTTSVQTTAVGFQAAKSTTGANNTAVGYVALRDNSTGLENSAFGKYALVQSTTGSYNTALGADALYSNTTASYNTAVGYQAGYANTTGAENVAVGVASLGSNTSGTYNVAVGRSALLNNTTASNNTAVGYQAGYSNTTGGELTAIGYKALFSNSTAYNNTAVGENASYANTTGAYTASLGRYAMYSNTTGNYNTAIGDSSLYSNTTSSNNTAVGYQAGYSSTTGGNNTFLGAYAGYYITSGTNNTIIGEYNGNFGGLDIRTSSNNIVLSDGDGNPRVHIDSSGTCKIGGGNTSQGYQSDGLTAFANGETTLVRDGNPPVTITRKSTAGSAVVFYNTTTLSGTISVNGSSTSYNTSSDYRLKENVVDLTGATERLKQLNPSRFNFIANADTTVDGFLAHEVQTVVPEAITGTHNEVDDDGNPVYQGIDQSKLVPLLVATIKELEARITALENA